MDWSKAKSIFIMVFFILDIFLLYQYLDKRENYQFEYMTEATIEEQLQDVNIKYGTLSKQKQKDQFLLAHSKEFETKDVANLLNQTVKIVNRTKIEGTFKQPIQMSKNFQSIELEGFLKDQIVYGNDYDYWNYDEATGEIIFYQNWDKKMFFNNSKGKITLQVNNHQQVISYEQTYLENIEKFNEPKDVVPAIKAIEVLYKNNDIKRNSNISNVELGYYNSLQTTSTTHLLVPAWRVVVNDEVNLFVNAFNGEVIELNTEEKILE